MSSRADGVKRRQQPNRAKSRQQSRAGQPIKLPQRLNDIYVTSSSDFTHQLTTCERLLDEGGLEVHIYGVGSAINRAINLVLQLREKLGSKIETSVTTSSVDINQLDFLEITLPEPETRGRNVSLLHIKTWKIHT